MSRGSHSKYAKRQNAEAAHRSFMLAKPATRPRTRDHTHTRAAEAAAAASVHMAGRTLQRACQPAERVWLDLPNPSALIKVEKPVASSGSSSCASASASSAV